MLKKTLTIGLSVAFRACRVSGGANRKSFRSAYRVVKSDMRTGDFFVINIPTERGTQIRKEKGQCQKEKEK